MALAMDIRATATRPTPMVGRYMPVATHQTSPCIIPGRSIMAPATARASTVPQEVVGNPSAMVAAMVGMQVALVDIRAAITEVATAKLSWPSGEL
jgi:hypothetical protein